jgi:cytochrome d ubiquinol oxidase subunit II
VPLDGEGWFALPLFTDWTGAPPVGTLDWYTVLVAVFAALALTGHGANFLVWKCDGAVAERARRLGGRVWIAVAAFWPFVTWATVRVNPAMREHFAARPLAWMLAAAAVAGLAAVSVGRRRERALISFLGSSAVIGGLLAATAACLYPVMLQASGGAPSIDARAANAGASGLRTALGWWLLGAPLAVAYFVLLFRIHRGKVSVVRDEPAAGAR